MIIGSRQNAFHVRVCGRHWAKQHLHQEFRIYQAIEGATFPDEGHSKALAAWKQIGPCLDFCVNARSRVESLAFASLEVDRMAKFNQTRSTQMCKACVAVEASGNTSIRQATVRSHRTVFSTPSAVRNLILHALVSFPPELCRNARRTLPLLLDAGVEAFDPALQQNIDQSSLLRRINR